MKKPPYSQILTASVVILVFGFVIFTCVEMHIQQDLSPLNSIGPYVIGLLATVVSAYMWRAKQSDQYTLDLMKSEEMAKGRQQYGTNYKSETVNHNDEDNSYSSNYSRYSNNGGYTNYPSDGEDPSG